ncbi:MAG: protein kinase, partial [Pyrinomonadaceae bacterium]|nr:protein kinase [Pyrinomonadaceae bacterium]
LDAPAYEVAGGQFVDDATKILIDERSLTLSGKRLGRYQVVSHLGSGGMAEVYLAEDLQLKRQVALKLLPAALTQDQERLLRFEQEALAASSLNHPNIITIHEIGQAEGLNFIVTEFIKGQTLRELMASSRMELAVALDVATQVASALAAAHASGIVHRDLKPENVMLRPDGLIKVLDFGLAKLTESPTSGVDQEATKVARVDTEVGMVIGTAQYMSPEQARGLKVDARTDIFSLGVVLYEMLAGRAPCMGATTADIISVLLHKEPQALTTLAPDVPADLQHIISKAMRKDRDERYQTIKSLLTDLKTFKQELDFAVRLDRSAPADTKGPATTSSAHATAAHAGTENAETQAPTARPTSSAEYIASRIEQHRVLAVSIAVLLLAAVGSAYFLYSRRASSTAQIKSIAVLPFVNESGNIDLEYLSDGMTESLINSLSRLPQLSVKARSSVFRYKGKQVESLQVAGELSVQAILSGRVVQRGDDLTLYLSLVDARNGNQIWGERYDRRLTGLVSLQSDIARDVSQKLRVRLSSADEEKVAKNYTANVEAYQLYLKGRYHVFKITPPEVQKGISFFQQAIAIDPAYALADVGLAQAYRTLSLSFDMPATEGTLKAKAAAHKAVELDDTLSEAHAVLGFSIFWYDWDFNAAENQCKRALELNPNSSDAHWAYGHLLSNVGRHAEALAEIKRARELDPLSLIVNTTEAQILLYAGQTDNALAALQKTFELDSRLWLTHMVASSAYIEKGMFDEALAEARKARELNGLSSIPISLVGYALAKAGKQAEARAVLKELLSLANQRYVSAYSIAIIHGGLGERDEAFAWLERGFKERDPKMVFLKIEPKWNNLRDDPRFHDLLRRVGF